MQTLDTVYQYVALVPMIYDGTRKSNTPTDTKSSDKLYLDFLKQLMLAMIVNFQQAMAIQESKLSALVKSLRAQLLPMGLSLL